MELIQLAKSFFTYQHDHRPRPALSEHSASNSMAQNSDQHMFHLQPTPPIPQPETLDPHELNHENENDGDTDGDSVYEDDDVEVGIDTESQNEMSEGLQLGSLDDCSNSLDAEIQILMAGTSQWLLKNILFRVPNLHFKDKIGNSPRVEVGEGGNRFRKGTPQEELSANHVLAERRRREKLNERFIILRSLVPFVTKVDKASILGDTIEYVKQLKRRIQELESRNKITESDQKCKARVHNTRKLRVVEHRKLTESKSSTITVEALSSSVQVSIIDNNALIELQCPYRERLLMHIMQTLDQLKLEITSIKSSSVNGMLSAQLQAKVKDIDKKKASLVEVEKAIYQVFSQ
ncbi:uncharacterized protein A4U43_C03F31930 [Asparagus officinalis]|uniref:BHLH domain-containing protein n=1 Tax=Asparagus officinalis TaxID=4686 RepID=A0A5P1FEH6_ASPOF|nr:uncharacterized protein A4U43_C03F31930 [Asparagus officinalis]